MCCKIRAGYGVRDAVYRLELVTEREMQCIVEIRAGYRVRDAVYS